MPSTKPNGGPAFPRAGDRYSGTDAVDGMSLRDYFAAQAISEWRVGAYDGSAPPPASDHAQAAHRCAALARHAYAIADAMLEERAK
jgi:hypothetical protein